MKITAMKADKGVDIYQMNLSLREELCQSSQCHMQNGVSEFLNHALVETTRSMQCLLVVLYAVIYQTETANVRQESTEIKELIRFNSYTE